MFSQIDCNIVKDWEAPPVPHIHPTQYYAIYEQPLAESQNVTQCVFADISSNGGLREDLDSPRLGS